jgi:Tol biopolymer transport system component
MTNPPNQRSAWAWRGILAIVAGCLVSLAGVRLAVGGGCNIVPRAVKLYRSTSGLVDRPVASPGDIVTLSADLACNAAGAGFALSATDNTITLEFNPPAGPAKTVTVDPSTLRVNACSDTRCNAIEFQVPDTAGQFGLPAGRTLTGPARIRVSRLIGSSQVTAADVFALQQPSLACEADAAEDVFGKFTVLPAPNRLATPGIPEFLGAVDGNGNLLIPIDFSGVLVAEAGDPVATILEISTPATSVIPDSRFLSAYNAFGRPVPPLLRLDSMKRIIGTTDVLRSVMRIARFDPDNPGAPIGMPEQDMVPNAAGEKIGPVVLGGPASPAPVSVVIRSAVPLLALKLATDALGVGAAEAVLGQDLNQDQDETDLIAQITDLTTGLQTDTNKALTEVTASPTRPAIVIDGDRVGFLESEARSGPTDYNLDGDRFDSILRVYESTGLELTSALPLTVDPHPLVNGRPLAISRVTVPDGSPPGAPYAFFRRAEADEALRTTKRSSENTVFEPGDSRREANGQSGRPSLNHNGTAVAFESAATNLVPYDQEGRTDVFVEQGGFIQRISEFYGMGGDGDSDAPAISDDGRYVAFVSEATNLTPESDPGFGGSAQILVHNRDTAELQLMSKSASGEVGNLASGPPSISSNGRFVAFASRATNLVPGDGNGVGDIILRDRDTDANGIFDETESTSMTLVRRDGESQSDGGSLDPAISADGNFVAFWSSASNLVPGDGNSTSDVFVYAVQTQTVERVSVNDNGEEGNDLSFLPAISGDGRFVAFASVASNLVPDDTNGASDVFVFDRASRTIERVSVNNQGEQAPNGFVPTSRPSISTDGRFVAFGSTASNLMDPLEDENGPGADVFVFDRLTHHIEQSSVSAGGEGANTAALEAAISGDGRAVGFSSRAANLIAIDSGEQQDVFVRGINRSGPWLNAAPDTDVDDVVAQVFDLTTGALLTNLKTASKGMTVAGARALVLVPEADEGNTNLNGTAASLLPSSGNDSDQNDTVAQLFDARTNTRLNLGVAASQAALSDEIVCLAVSEAAQGFGGGTDLNGDGDKSDQVLVYGKLPPTGAAIVGNQLFNTEVAVDTVVAVGSVCVVITPEAGQGAGGTNLNGDASKPNPDNDELDRVLQIWATGGASPGLNNTHQAATDLFGEPGTPLIAFRTCEADQGGGAGNDLNDDRDRMDCVMQVYDLALAGIIGTEPSPDPAMALTSTQRQAILCDFPGCEAFRLASVVGRTVSFVGTEQGQTVSPIGCLPSSKTGECDLDGDGDGMGRVVHVLTIERGMITSAFVLPVSDVDPELDPLAVDKGGQIQADVLITECEAARQTCPETRSRVPVNGFLTVQSACEAASDISPAGPNGNGDGLLDCITPRFYFTGDKDGDGAIDTGDNCVQAPNPLQQDMDEDGLGDQMGNAGCDTNPSSVLPGKRDCDLNKDGVIDRADIDLIFHDRNTPAAASDQRDRDQDLRVTVFDSRICATKCTNPGCEPSPPAPVPPSCGLLGIEALLPLALLARRRRR